MKRLLVIVLIVVLTIGTFVIVSDAIHSDKKDDFNVWLDDINTRWGIKLKETEKCIFSKSNREGLQGDGYSCLIVQYKDKETVKKMLDWAKTTDDARADIKAILDNLDVDTKKRPDINNLLLYKMVDKEDDHDELYVIYDPDKPKNLYIIESYF